MLQLVTRQIRLRNHGQYGDEAGCHLRLKDPRFGISSMLLLLAEEASLEKLSVFHTKAAVKSVTSLQS